VILVCAADGAGGMSCTSSTYLDRLIAWYVGAEEIEQCLQTKKLSCLKGLALSALKLKFLKKGRPCEKNSFVPGTRVLMAGHRTKPIEDIRTGDRVIATDPRTGRTAAKPVQATITGFGRKDLVRVTVTGPGARSSGTVTATGKHPFWAAGGRNAWLDAEQVKPGERLLTDAGSQARIDATKSWTTSRQRVHNLTVADLHTYYVLAGETPVLVHNTNPGDCFRGARAGESPSFHPRSTDYKIDAKTGFVRESHGVSVFDNSGSVSSKGFIPHQIDQSSFPSTLRVIRRGRDPRHYEIVPAPGANLTPERYAEELAKIKTR
jgi:hypothetical protein